MTIAENLIQFIKTPAVEIRINRDKYADLTFIIRDGKVVKIDGDWILNRDDIKIGGSE